MNPDETGAMSILEPVPGPAQGDLIEFAWWLKKQGKAEKTINNYVVMLRLLRKHGADLSDPESVKETLARLDRAEGWKILAVNAYSAFLKMLGRMWEKPKISKPRKIPFIPLESELDALIAASGPKLSALLRLLKETGMRIGEALRLRWTDVDFERGTIILNTPEKNGNPRIFKVSSDLIGMLNRLPRRGELVFQTSKNRIPYGSIKAGFEAQRRRLAEKLNNPRLLKISFHTFRHWKATMEYHRFKDVLHVKELLGHQSINSTLLYIQVEKALFSEDSGEFTARIAKNMEEAKELVEAGFEFVHEHDGLMLFRRRK